MRGGFVLVNGREFMSVGGADDFCTAFARPQFPAFRYVIDAHDARARIRHAVFVKEHGVGKRGLLRFQRGEAFHSIQIVDRHFPRVNDR